MLSIWWLVAAAGFGPPIGSLFWAVLLLAAVLTAVYTAFLFAQARGRDFWQSPALALHMLVDALLAGTAVLAVIDVFSSLPEAWGPLLRTLLLAGLAAHLLTLLVELTMPHATEDAERAAHDIVAGRLAGLFWGAGIIVGGLVPIALLLLAGPLWLAAALILAGIYVVEYAWVRAPQMIPLS